MEHWQDLSLQVRCEINQQVAATNQVHLREGWIHEDILFGEDDHLTQKLGDAITALLLDKEPAQPFRRKLVQEGFGIETGAALVEGCLADVGGEKLQRSCWSAVLGEF